MPEGHPDLHLSLSLLLSARMCSSLFIVSLLVVLGIQPAAEQYLLYATGGGLNNLPAVIDPSTNSIARIVQSGGDSFFAAVTPAGSRAYFTDAFNQCVTEVDPVSDIRLATIPMPSEPFYVALNYDGTRLYVALSNALAVIDNLDRVANCNRFYQSSVEIWRI